MVQQNALHSSIALSCALQIRMITIRRQDQALDSFEASACSSLHTLNDASWLVLSYTRFPTEKRQLCAKGKLHLGMARRNRACFSTGSTPAGVRSPDEHAGGARDR